MYYAALAVSTVIAVAYLAIAWTIATRVLVRDAQWRHNPLAVATAGIFFSCGVGHGLHGVHLLEHGPTAALLFDPHVVSWDATTAVIATWYWSLRSRLSALGTNGHLFQDARAQERSELAGVLHELFDGVQVLPARPSGEADLPDALRGEAAAAALRLVRDVGRDGRARTGEVRTAHGVLDLRASLWTDQVVLAWLDVTALREAQRVRADAEAQLAAAFDAAPVAMVVLQDGAVARGNRALAGLTGHEDASRSFPDLFEPADRAVAAARLVGVRGQASEGSWEARLLQAGGPSRWVEVSLAPVADGPAGRGAQVVAHLVDVEARKAYDAQLRHLADHDPLTGLVNRRRLDQELQAHCARPRTAGPGGALLLLDLDHFKEVNDTLGHGAGDRLLVGLADVLRREVRAGDVVARLGGDEFAVLAPDAEPDDAVALAERLCEAVRDHVRGLAGPLAATGRVTCSLGLVLLGAEHTPESALVAADLTLYDAKEAGRDRTAVYSTEARHQPRTKRRLELLDRLRTALEDDSLVVVGQPVVDLQTRQVEHLELLVRLRDHDGALLLPSSFLPSVEATELVSALDLWMVAFAVAEARRRPGTSLCVNVSGRTLSDPAALDRLEQVVRAAALPAGTLVLEVTETSAVQQLKTAGRALQRLRAAGCLVALDDFGAGFCGLSYVKHLPFDVLKLDGQFVASCKDDPTDLVLVDAVVALARGLGKTVVAEHVEDEVTAQLLQRHGVQQGQGFHLGAPLLLTGPPLPRRPLDGRQAAGSGV